MALRIIRTFLTLSSLFLSGNCIQIWSSPGALPTAIPASCCAALSTNITCSPDLVSARFISSGRSLDNAILNQYCTPTCASSLRSYQRIVDLRCGNTLYTMWNGSTPQSGPSVADPLAWAYNVTCLQDEAGFCLAALYNGTKSACSNCSLSYGAVMLASDYGRARVQPDGYSSLLSSCGVPASEYPYNYSPTVTGTATATPTASPAINCTCGQYVVGSQDTCQSISAAKSIAIDRLISANELDYNCTSLTAGTTLCLTASCALHTVQINETCAQIVANQSFTSVQLASWNPTIHANCDNLDAMVGRSICVSPPGEQIYQVTSYNYTTTATMTSMFPGPYETGSILTAYPNITTSWYVNTTLPALVTHTTTVNYTAASLIAQRTQYCPITFNQTLDGWSIADLPDACENLLDPYCNPNPDAPIPTSTKFPAVCSPSYYITSTTSSAAGATPSPLEPNTISSCKQYYQIESGDTCSSIATQFNISLDQFNTWNPYPGSDCSKLYLGYYVCISA